MVFFHRGAKYVANIGTGGPKSLLFKKNHNTTIALSVPEGANSIANFDGGPWPDLTPLDPPLPSCPICSHLHHAQPGLLRGWRFGMEWSPIGSSVTSKSILPEIPSAT